MEVMMAEYPKMMYLKAQDISEGVKVYKIIDNSEQEQALIAEGYVSNWQECGIEEVRKRGRPPKAPTEPTPEQPSSGLFD